MDPLDIYITVWILVFAVWLVAGVYLTAKTIRKELRDEIANNQPIRDDGSLYNQPIIEDPIIKQRNLEIRNLVRRCESISNTLLRIYGCKAGNLPISYLDAEEWIRKCHNKRIQLFKAKSRNLKHRRLTAWA